MRTLQAALILGGLVFILMCLLGLIDSDTDLCDPESGCPLCWWRRNILRQKGPR